MGLLDQVLGNVLGSRSGGGLGGNPSAGMGSSGGGTSPIMMALMTLLAAKAMGGPGGLGGMLGGTGATGGGLGGLLGGTGGGLGTTGGGLGGLLGGGLGGLLDALQQSGHGDIAQSWIGRSDNRPIAPNQLMDALGPDTVEQLQRQTGLPREELLSELSQTLPHAVDQLTPEGRLPTQSEMERW
jgi:uncharacterized protein YidB (DUF937 family)